MRRALICLPMFLAVVALGYPQHRRFMQPNLEGDATRRVSPYAAFEFAPSDGFGMGLVCAGTIPTDTRGVTPTFTRAGTAQCMKGTSFVTDIAVGDMVELTANQPRIVYGDSTGVLGFQCEKTRANDCLQSEAFGDAAWVSTAAVASDQALSPKNTLTVDTLTDSSGAALQGSCQTITTTSQTKHAVSVFVQAGNQAEAQITMTGVGDAAGDCSATATGLSSTTFTRLRCGSAAAYGAALTAVVVCINVGDAAGDQGTLNVWGFQHEVNRFEPTTYIPVTTVAVTQAVDTPLTFAQNGINVTSAGSAASTFIPSWANNEPSTTPYLLFASTNGRFQYSGGSNHVVMFDGTTELANATTWTAYTAKRIWSSWSGSSMSINDAADTQTGSFDGTMAGTTSFRVGSSAATEESNGVIKRVCIDPDPLRCR